MIGIGDGSHNSMIRNAIKLGEGHLTVQPRGYIEAPANHKYLANGKTLQAKLDALNVAGSVEPRIALQVLASTASNSVGAGLEGLSPGGDERVETLKPQLVDGEWLEAGDERGIFDSRVDELDDYLILSDIQFARYFLIGEGADPELAPVTRFAVFLDAPDNMADWKARLESALESDDVVVLDWQEMMPQLVQFVMVDDAGNYVFLVLILIMVVFGILNTVLMSVLERTREFGLLRALGLSRRQLLLLVFCESLLLSLLAEAIGWLVGGGTHLWFSTHGIDMEALVGGGTAMMGTFMDSVIYTELSWDRVVQLTLIIFAATLSSGIYPALKAARVTPVEALRT